MSETDMPPEPEGGQDDEYPNLIAVVDQAIQLLEDVRGELTGEADWENSDLILRLSAMRHDVLARIEAALEERQ